MLYNMLKCKLHQAIVTQCNLHYEGSIGIDECLLETVGLMPNEAVHIWNINNGSRIQTYVIPAKRGSGQIGLNGAAARYAQVGDQIIIAAFWVDDDELQSHRPRIALIGENNPVSSFA